MVKHGEGSEGGTWGSSCAAQSVARAMFPSIFWRSVVTVWFAASTLSAVSRADGGAMPLVADLAWSHEGGWCQPMRRLQLKFQTPAMANSNRKKNSIVVK